MTKSAEEHLADGTFRKHRHADRVETQLGGTLPEKPRNMGPLASRLWDQVIDRLPSKLVDSLDEAKLILMCQNYQLAMDTAAMLDDNPTDKEFRCAYLAYVEAFEKFASQFGMSPKDRQKVKLPKGETKAQNDLRNILESRN